MNYEGAMDTIPGYTILNQIFLSSETRVFRVQKNDSHDIFILKTIASTHTSPRENIKYLHEYEILKKLKDLKSNGVIKVSELKIFKNNPCLIMEDFGGRDLKNLKTSWDEKPWDPEIVLNIGIKITKSLGEIYKAQIIHKDIKPGNIIFNPETGILKLVDFSSAGFIFRENSILSESDKMSATMAYMSPEQTGRMNRMVDWRSDFYSLGVTLYELSTGILPFCYDDPMEMIHAHIARIPVSPHIINKKIPVMLSNIILKLMDKDADQRYQSAYGIRYDLEQCLNQIRNLSANNSFGDNFPLNNSGSKNSFKNNSVTPCISNPSIFELGAKDISDRLLIPEKLYGRDQEIKTMITGFKEVCKGAGRLVFVTGEPGSGKSALIKEAQKLMVQDMAHNITPDMMHERTCFISGKFDHLKRIPYGAFIQAFESLIRRILSEDDYNLSIWRKKLIKALTPNGQIIVDIIPDLELIIGKQTPVPVLGPVENENRFINIFEKFIFTFISKENPLILFLDDIQWADSASLNMISVLQSFNPRFLYIICAFRSNEVVADNPLLTLFEEIKTRGTGTCVETISLSLLTKLQVNQLIADTMLCSVERAKSLSDLCFAKTRGNPFFLNQFILSLFNKKFIRLNAKLGRWEWDYKEIEHSNITDNVAHLMADKIDDLSQDAQKILKYASCIGHEFDLHTLSILYGRSSAETAMALSEVLQQEFILPLDESYKYMSHNPVLSENLEPENSDMELSPSVEFESELLDSELSDSQLSNSELSDLETLDKSEALDKKVVGQESLNEEFLDSELFFMELKNCRYRFLHDRVQQAAYSLLQEKEKKKIHLKIGEELLKDKNCNHLENRIFDIADHLNLSCELIKETDKKNRAAELNLMAGKKAKKSAAFNGAMEYIIAGISILGENSWIIQYDLTKDLYEQAAETAFLCGNFKEMDDFFAIVMENAKTILDTIHVYKIKIQACIAQHQLKKAVETGFYILKKLGVSFPESPGKLSILWEYLKTKIKLMGKSHENLINMRTMTDPYALATLDIMQTMGFSVYVAAPEIAPLFIFKGISLSVKYGNTLFSSVFYGHYGIVLCSMIKNIKSGYEFGRTSLRLLNKFNAMEFAAKTEVVFNFFIRHWKEPLRESLPPLKNAYKKGFQTGDFEFAAAAASQYAYISYFAGVELPKLERRAFKYNKIIKGLKQKSWLSYNERTWQTVLNLMEYNGNPTILTGDVFDEKIMLMHYMKENDKTGICSLYINKLILCYLFHDYNKALEYAVRAEADLVALRSHAVIPVFNFYDSLTRLALFRQSSKKRQKKFLQKLAINQKKMKQWALQSPANYHHKWCLVEAERSGILGKNNQAIKFYNTAVIGAEDNQYIQEQAVINELASVFYGRIGDHDKAQQHIKEAKNCYEIWGAMAKVHEINELYHEILSKNDSINDSIHNFFPGKKFAGSESLNGIHPESSFVSDLHLSDSKWMSTSTFMEKDSLDLNSAIKASQIISKEIQIEKLIANLMEIIVESAGAQKGFLIMKSFSGMTIEAEYRVDEQNTIVMHSVSVDDFSDIAKNVVHYTVRTKKSIVLDDASNKGKFTEDPHIMRTKPKSVLCAPLIHQGNLIGIIYLENNLIAGAFTKERLEILFLLCSQAAISLENAKLYKSLQNYTSDLEKKVEERTKELQKSIETIKRTQDQLVQSEKLAALGSLVAGVAHEINTPVGIAVTSASLLKDKTENFIYKLESKTLKRSDVNKYMEIAGKSSDLILTNLNRAVKIIHGFKQVSVDQISEKCREFNLKSYINDILASLAPKLKKINPKITINCPDDLVLKSFPGAFSQIVTNLIINSLVHGFESDNTDKIVSDKNRKSHLSSRFDTDNNFDKSVSMDNTGIKNKLNDEVKSESKNTNEIIFDIHRDNDTIIIYYMDNGKGIKEKNKEKIFNPFFTTRRSKGGSGLGMYIVHNLVTQTLGGSISYNTRPEKGVKFTINLPKTIYT